VPGLPAASFGGVGAGLLLMYVALVRRSLRPIGDDEQELAPPVTGDDTMIPLASPVTVTLGADLVQALRDRGEEQALRDEIRSLREAWFLRTGVRLPAVRVRWGRGDARSVLVDVYESRVRSAMLDPDTVLVFGPPPALDAVAGDLVLHPVSGAAGRRIAGSAASDAAAAGLDVLPLLRQIVLEIAAAATASIERFVGVAEVQSALDAAEASHAALVEAVVPKPLTVARLTGVLRRLAAEGVSIRDLRGILEALAEEAHEADDIITLTEIARRGVSHELMARYAPDGVLRVVLVDPSIEQTIRDAITRDGRRPGLALAPAVTDDILAAFEPHRGPGRGLVVLVATDVRRYLRQLLALRFDHLVVLGTAELNASVRVEQMGVAVPGRR
jgi:type III secretion protein V